MSLSTDTNFSVETMSEIAQLANRISKPAPMSVQEMNVEAAKIAEEVGVVVGDILQQLAQHVERRSSVGHPSERNEASVGLTRFRDNNK